jgi:signal transduction histidine kinase/CheY-like chemotaxis protein
LSLDTHFLSDRRLREALDALNAAVVADHGLDALSAELARIASHLVGADLGQLRLARTPLLADDGLSPLPDGLTARITELPVDSRHRGRFMAERGMRALYVLPLHHRERLVAALYVGLVSDRKLSAEEQALLIGFSAHAATAIGQRLVEEELRQGIVARGEILAVVAHDLRNPIGVIQMAATSLYQRLTDPTARRGLERIQRSAQRAERFLHDLLDVTAIEAGQFTIETRRVDAAATVLAAVESQQPHAALARLILSSDVSPDLPPAQSDEERLLEVLENLIGNATKFTPAGGTVTVGASRSDEGLLFWVKDTGVGIPTDQLPFLFDRFWQARKRDRRGAGLGLSICKAIVEAHGGRIWAESEVGVGTTMWFTVPSSQPRTTVEAPPTQAASILIVDDRPENLLSLRAILERPQYRLVSARSGEEALSLALRETFAVALIDIAMPGMDGLEVATHLKELERSRHTPIIFITAFGNDPHEIHRAYSAGGADYLIKPLDAEIVRKKVAVFVDMSRRRLEHEGATALET